MSKLVFKKKKFNYNDFIGDIYSLKYFLNMVKNGMLIEDDGCIGEILVNGKVLDMIIYSWNKDDKDDKDDEDSLFGLTRIKGHVQVVWCNK